MTSVNSSLKKTVTDQLDVGGLTPFTTIDFPGQLSAVLFLQGCPWRCDYCHNKSLISRQVGHRYQWGAILEFLQRRKGLIDAVVFSGGEPTLQAALPSAIEEVRQLGFKTALHTAGVYPDRLENLLPLLDWIGLDFKAPAAQYEEITGVSGSAERARLSVKMVVDSGIDYEVRTTLHPCLLETDSLDALVNELISLGVSNFSLQKCNLEFCTSLESDRLSVPLPDQGDVLRIGELFSNFNFRDFQPVT